MPLMAAAGQVREWVPLMAAAGRVRHSWCRQQWLRDGEKCPALGDGGTGERVVPPTTTAGQGERERVCGYRQQWLRDRGRIPPARKAG